MNNMSVKKLFSRIFILISFLMIIINVYFSASCEETTQNQKNHSISILVAGSANVSGSWTIMAEGIAEIIREELTGSNITVVPGGSDQNLAMLKNGDVDLAITATDSAESAVNGWGPFSTPIFLNEVQTIASLYDSKIQFVVLDSVKINSIEEIKEKRIPLKLCVGRIGSGMEMAARRIFEEYGITFKDIESWGGKISYFSQTESIRMLGDGQLNAFINSSIVPLADLTELALKRDFKILPIPDDIIDKLVKKYNYTSGVIVKGTYKGVTEDILTLSVANGLFASGKLDDQKVYLISKALSDNIESLRQIHSQLNNITIDYMNRDIVFPIHPEAQRAYQE